MSQSTSQLSRLYPAPDSQLDRVFANHSRQSDPTVTKLPATPEKPAAYNTPICLRKPTWS